MKNAVYLAILFLFFHTVSNIFASQNNKTFFISLIPVIAEEKISSSNPPFDEINTHKNCHFYSANQSEFISHIHQIPSLQSLLLNTSVTSPYTHRTIYAAGITAQCAIRAVANLITLHPNYSKSTALILKNPKLFIADSSLHKNLEILKQKGIRTLILHEEEDDIPSIHEKFIWHKLINTIQKEKQEQHKNLFLDEENVFFYPTKKITPYIFSEFLSKIYFPHDHLPITPNFNICKKAITINDDNKKIFENFIPTPITFQNFLKKIKSYLFILSLLCYQLPITCFAKVIDYTFKA